MTDGIIAPSNPIGSPSVAAPAPAPASEAAPIANASDDTIVHEPNPIKSETPEKPEVKTPTKKSSIADSLNKATDAINKQEALKAKEGEVKPAEVKTAEVKLADPKAKPAEAPKTADAPEWMNEPKAKAKWATVDDDVRVEVDRRVNDLLKGHEKYKADATEFGELKEFKELAKKYNVPLKDAMANYVAMDQALQSTDMKVKLSAIDEMFKAAKIDPRKYAEFISKQPADQVAVQTNETIGNLQQQVKQLSEQVKGVSTNVETQQTEQAKAYLTQWAQDKPHAGRLAEQIAKHVDSGLDLDSAYAKAVSDVQELAQSLGFVAPPAATTTPNVIDLAARTPKTDKSITGAPSPGSHPATHKPSKSIAEAVERAMSLHG